VSAAPVARGAGVCFTTAPISASARVRVIGFDRRANVLVSSAGPVAAVFGYDGSGHVHGGALVVVGASELVVEDVSRDRATESAKGAPPEPTATLARHGSAVAARTIPRGRGCSRTRPGTVAGLWIPASCGRLHGGTAEHPRNQPEQKENTQPAEHEWQHTRTSFRGGCRGPGR